jgi:ribosomal protein L7/L12
MTTIIACVVAFLVLLVLFFATGTKTPPRPLSELPTPSTGVRTLANDDRIIEAIKLYRQEAGTSLHEAKQVVDSIRG